MHVAAAEAPVAAENVPAPQSAQALAAEAPDAARYFPAPQAVHAAEPAAALKKPAAHGAHGPPSGPLKPTLHRQPPRDALPATEIEFAGQSLHAAEPAPSLYFPARHSTQVCPSAPVAPALHLQSVIRADADEEFESAGHASQLGLPSGDHMPAAHGRHISAPLPPTAAEYSPPAHSEHS